MKKRKFGLSAAVQKRIAERRKMRIGRWMTNTAYLMILVSSFAQIYFSHKKAAMIDAPSWAEFRAYQGRKEVIASAWSDGVPARLLINGETWQVVQVQNFKDYDGYRDGVSFPGVQAETYCEQKVIAYITSADKIILRENLLHEVFHAGSCLHGGDTWWNSINPTRTDHIGVYHLGEFMAGFIHDNPQFAAWAEQ